jgi:SPP1 family predicted phage head-tail adaptor
MRAGALRYRVTLQEPDATGTSGYADVATVSADVTFSPASGESMQGGGLAAVASHRMRLRYRSDVRAEWRVVLSDRTFQISGYGDPDGRKRELVLVCAEVQ